MLGRLNPSKLARPRAPQHNHCTDAGILTISLKNQFLDSQTAEYDGRIYYGYDKGLMKVTISTGKGKTLSKHTGMGICGVHGDVLVYARYREDFENGSDIDLILARLSDGKTIKKVGAYFVS